MQKDEKTLQINGFVGFFVFLSLNVLAILRRGRDSNPRYPFGVHTLSKRTSSATRAPLRFYLECKCIKIIW